MGGAPATSNSYCSAPFRAIIAIGKSGFRTFIIEKLITAGVMTIWLEMSVNCVVGCR
jgi:hypothetical protein